MDVPAKVLSLVLLTTSLSLFAAVPLSAHPGGRDRYGCHHDRKRGGYHCHAGPFAGQSFASQAEMLAVSKGFDPRGNAPPAHGNVTPPSATRGAMDESGQVCIREHRTQQIMCGELVR